MDIAVAALIITGACLVGLICLGAPSPVKPDPKTVECPKCKTRSSLADIRCPNCGNKKLRINRANPASPIVECPECKINAAKLPCPKCGTDLIKLLIV